MKEYEKSAGVDFEKFRGANPSPGHPPKKDGLPWRNAEQTLKKKEV
jgi:hypothetical protein